MWGPETWTVVVVAVAIGAAGGKFWREFLDAIERFRGGGPPRPMHPSPANDGVLLLKRRDKR